MSLDEKKQQLIHKFHQLFSNKSLGEWLIIVDRRQESVSKAGNHQHQAYSLSIFFEEFLVQALNEYAQEVLSQLYQAQLVSKPQISQINQDLAPDLSAYAKQVRVALLEELEAVKNCQHASSPVSVCPQHPTHDLAAFLRLLVEREVK